MIILFILATKQIDAAKDTDLPILLMQMKCGRIYWCFCNFITDVSVCACVRVLDSFIVSEQNWDQNRRLMMSLRVEIMWKFLQYLFLDRSSKLLTSHQIQRNETTGNKNKL